MTAAPLIVVVVVVVLLAATGLEAVSVFEFVYSDNEEEEFLARGLLEEDSLFQQNVRAAGDLWTAELDVSTKETASVIVVSIKPMRARGRASGTFNPGRQVGRLVLGGDDGDDGSDNVFRQAQNVDKDSILDLSVVEPAPRQVILTDSSPSDSEVDIIIQLHIDYVDQLWLDPTPHDRTDERVPIGRVDFISVLLHELGHGLGMAGYRRAPMSGEATLPNGVASLFDALSFFDTVDGSGNGPAPLLFHGPNVMALNCGNPMPLSHFEEGHFLESSNFYHIGSDRDVCRGSNNNNQNDESSLTDRLIRESLMRSCPPPIDGNRLSISLLDRAVLADMGYPLKTTTTPALQQFVLENCPTQRPPPSPPSLCSASPQSFCETASRAKLVIRSKKGASRQSLQWRLRGDGNRQRESASVWGLPTVGTDFSLCVYRDGQMVQELHVPANPQRWNQTRPSQFVYHDPNTTTSAEMTLRRVSLKAGASRDRSRAVQVVLATHDSLPTPAWTLPTQFQIGITVQLVHNLPYSDTCFGATLSNAAIRTNTPTRFVAQFKEF